MSEMKTEEIVVKEEQKNTSVAEYLKLLESELTEDAVNYIWNSLGCVSSEQNHTDTDFLKHFKYPINVILELSTNFDLNIENARYITDYSDICKLISELLVLYDKCLNEFTIRKDVIELYYKKHKSIDYISKELNLSESVVSFNKKITLGDVGYKMCHMMNKIMDTFIVSIIKESDNIEKILDVDIRYVIRDSEICVLLNSEGYKTLHDIYFKYTNEDYLSEIINKHIPDINRVVLRILHKNNYTDEEVTSIKESYTKKYKMNNEIVEDLDW